MLGEWFAGCSLDASSPKRFVRPTCFWMRRAICRVTNAHSFSVRFPAFRFISDNFRGALSWILCLPSGDAFSLLFLMRLPVCFASLGNVLLVRYAVRLVIL